MASGDGAEAAGRAANGPGTKGRRRKRHTSKDTSSKSQPTLPHKRTRQATLFRPWETQPLDLSINSSTDYDSPLDLSQNSTRQSSQPIRTSDVAGTSANYDPETFGLRELTPEQDAEIARSVSQGSEVDWEDFLSRFSPDPATADTFAAKEFYTLVQKEKRRWEGGPVDQQIFTLNVKKLNVTHRNSFQRQLQLYSILESAFRQILQQAPPRTYTEPYNHISFFRFWLYSYQCR